MVNLHVRANMVGAIIVNHPALPLDAILLHSAYEEAFKGEFYLLPNPKIQQVDLPTDYNFPVEQIDFQVMGINPMFACSAARYETLCEEIIYFNRRNRLNCLVRLTDVPTLINFKGRYKDAHQPYLTLQTRYIDWYLRTSNPDHVKRLLERKSSIGAKTTSGYGVVAKWEIEQVTEDWSVWQQSRPAKAIPTVCVENGDDNTVYQLEYCGYRPNYWQPENQTFCVVPDWL